MMYLFFFLILSTIVFFGYVEMRDMPSSKGRPRQQVMVRTFYAETRDTGFAG